MNTAISLIHKCMDLEAYKEGAELADQIFCMIFNLRSSRVCLEDVLQIGNRELPEFDEFLKLWIDYLCDQRGRRAGELLKEAQTMVQDD